MLGSEARRPCELPTSHDIKHITLLIRPMNSQCFDQLCKIGIFFDTGEDIESFVDVVELVVAEVEVEGVEDVTLGDLAVEGGDGHAPSICENLSQLQ